MPHTLRLNVLSRKSYGRTELRLADAGQNVLSFCSMARNISEEEFRNGFTARVKAAREATGLSQADMAKLLDLEQGTYHKYEGRTCMPHRTLMRFCSITGATIQHIYYGPHAAAVAARTKRRKAG